MPDGIIPAVSALFNRLFRPGQSSIREMTAAELAQRNRSEADDQSAAESGQRPTTTTEVR
jgi:branched-chain amino acid transport system permease protein